MVCDSCVRVMITNEMIIGKIGHLRLSSPILAQIEERQVGQTGQELHTQVRDGSAIMKTESGEYTQIRQ
jgi:hypothetical protein